MQHLADQLITHGVGPYNLYVCLAYGWGGHRPLLQRRGLAQLPVDWGRHQVNLRVQQRQKALSSRLPLVGMCTKTWVVISGNIPQMIHVVSQVVFLCADRSSILIQSQPEHSRRYITALQLCLHCSSIRLSSCAAFPPSRSHALVKYRILHPG